MNTSSNVCIYHDADLDGFCSGAIWKSYCNDMGIECEMIGTDYGQPLDIEQCRNKHVAVLDFSIQPFSRFIELMEIAKSVTWIDHHISAIKEYEKADIPAEVRKHLITHLDTTFAACELTWKHLYEEIDMPRGVFWLGDYDCWRHSDPHTMPFQYGARTLYLNPVNPDAMETWDAIFDNTAIIDAILDYGRVILRYQTQQNERTARTLWMPITFCEKQWMAINQGGINSQVWDSVWDDAYDGMLGFVRTRHGWKITLYSKTTDCSVIAKEYGGGGHAGAAGFQCDELPFAFPHTLPVPDAGDNA